jgi:hypothetical protein
MLPTAPMSLRVWGLRDELSVYDECHVALTVRSTRHCWPQPQRFASATGIRCPIEVI